jgi:hypothetical protein
MSGTLVELKVYVITEIIHLEFRPIVCLFVFLALQPTVVVLFTAR